MSRAVHGEPDLLELAALGLGPANLLDLSTNVARGEPPAAVVAAVRSAPLRAYPDRHALAARRALAHAFGCAPDHVLPGHGAAELIFSTVVAFAVGRGSLLAWGPTFGEPAHAARALKVPYTEVRASPADDFAPRLEALASALTPDVALVYVCDPNNPTGRGFPAGALEALAAENPGQIFLVDQSFRALSTAALAAVAPSPPNLLRLRSLTKELSLAGVRVGALLGAPAHLAVVDASRPSWVVSAPALAALEVLPDVLPEVERRRVRWLHERACLDEGLRGAGLTVVPSDTVFSLVFVRDAGAVRSALLRDAGVLVRSCESFGLPEFVRLTACADEDREHVVRSMARAVAACAGPRGGET